MDMILKPALLAMLFAHLTLLTIFAPGNFDTLSFLQRTLKTV